MEKVEFGHHFVAEGRWKRLDIPTGIRSGEKAL